VILLESILWVLLTHWSGWLVTFARYKRNKSISQAACVRICVSVYNCALRDILTLQERTLRAVVSKKTSNLQFHIFLCIILTVCIFQQIRPREAVLDIYTLLCGFVQNWLLQHLISNLYFHVCYVFAVSSATDIDECQHRSLCTNGRCRNTEGSFRCVCSQGYTLSSTGDQCEGKLVDFSY